ncbi:PREDICTED: ribosyldihydronicotinamide dehydrogenase [quinone] [Elephantulus edwardii]|uniref:ribosyldihydronicotinamide dehydrogenase [quinone] n=1 Tax=Elephantulus edwardii TaxID=28737 RepID=UPI0003F0B6E6|nr:PREDICTED: ribosyldihydronicotinamide dehydrogenase [quinone] [Elephantulus edwardii]
MSENKKAGKKVLLVYAHQNPSPLDTALKTATEDELSKQGCTVTVSSLYNMDFGPRASGDGITGECCNPELFSNGVGAYDDCREKSLAQEITDEQKKVKEADLVIFQFPLHLFSMPAVLRGWMDKVLTRGFAYKTTESSRVTLLKGKLAISVTRGDHVWNDIKNTDNEDPLAYLWPLPHGVLHLCGFKVLAPQISSPPKLTSEEQQKGMVESWVKRLKTIWIEEPIKPRCTLKLL